MRILMGMNTTNRAAETFEETCTRYLAKYGAAGLRSMASEWRLYLNHGGACPAPRYAVAARVVASLTDIGAI